ncbi:DUF4439 domain-containing protein [Jonesia quinghaiensis]|uniref:DUF4439 domain-containing protein n=1 Tax=Jonesia quinghaiensis TaxID=262806 RepID=UPI000419D005|nr:DUF4439 domain-containing protein [Jonesia quinghaiensis]
MTFVARINVRTFLTSLVVLLLVAGCGVRIETAPPTEPTPDSNEVARQAVVNDLLSVSAAAALLTQDDAQSDAVVQALESLALQASDTATQLGGEYDSGLPEELRTSRPEPSQSSETTAPATAQDLVDQLNNAANRIRSTLDLPEDPDVARAYGSLATWFALQASDIARLSKIDYELPPDFTDSELEALPSNITQANVITWITREDAAAYGFEVIAAMLPVDDRAYFTKQAREHRRTAQHLAVLAAVDRTSDDPRALRYDLPFTLTPDSPTPEPSEARRLGRELCIDLGEHYSTALATVEPQDRAAILDLLVPAAQCANRLGSDMGPFVFIESPEAITASTPEVSN